MLRSLARRDDGYELFEITTIDDLDLPALALMIDAAWRLDYQDTSRLDFNETVLRKYMHGDAWTGVLVRSKDGELVGFELALERTLRVRDQILESYYASVLTVSAEHRGKGLGHLVLEGINRLVFDERQADVILSTFHEGHAGSPAVQSTFDRIEGFSVSRFHRAAIWSRRLDREILPPLVPPPNFVQLVSFDGGATLKKGALSHGEVAIPDAGVLDRLILEEFETSFALDSSLASQYLNADNPASGVFFYRLGSGRQALLAWNLLPMAINERHLRPIGQLQLILAPGCDERELELLVHHLALFMAERGCFALTVVDMGALPKRVLRTLGLRESEDIITFAARGPRCALDSFESLEPPFFIDFT